MQYIRGITISEEGWTGDFLVPTNAVISFKKYIANIFINNNNY